MIRQARRAALVLPLLVALGLLALPAATADSYYPLLTVTADDHELGQSVDLGLNTEYLSSAAPAERLTIQTPSGFNASLVQAPGTKLGSALLGVLPTGTNISASPSASIVEYKGSLLVMDPAAYASDQGAQACAPGTHTAVWDLDLVNVAHGNITLPVAVDASRGGYRLTMCFDAIQAAGKEVEYVYLAPDGIFRNPGRHGEYLFDGVVTPFATAGGPNGAGAYELRSYDPLPQDLSGTATYDPHARVLTVQGLYDANGRARKNVDIDVFGAKTPDALNWTKLGYIATGSSGSYTFTRKFGAFHDTYIYTAVHEVNGPACSGHTAQPAGCASTFIDGRASAVVKIAVLS